ncbi:fibrobacter succinogenes major paralogous domain-containing protein [Chryseobacterium potabilaquae]|nr:FISUMP domain-containing protein [Chryseobacterium potabilaquae]
MKKTNLLILMFLSTFSFGQVGINNPSPKSTLEITATKTDGSTSEGLIIPRLPGNALFASIALGIYGNNQNGSIVYVTLPADNDKQIGQTIHVNGKGYYYFDADQNQWLKLGDGTSIYSADGTLASPRHVTMDGNNLGFTGGRIGMGIASPDPSAILDLTSTVDGFLVPRMTEAQMNAIIHPAHGLQIFCTDCFNDLGCLMINDSKDPLIPNWGSLCSSNVPTGHITDLQCSSATNSGTLHSGVAASGVSSSITYTGANGGTYPSAAFNSIGVTGLTANLDGGSLVNGSGNLIFTITGTPSAVGTASFNITVGGASCTLSIPVVDFTASVITLECSTAVFSPNTITQGDAYTGTLTVPYTGGNGDTYPQQSFTQNGLTFTLPAGTLATGNGNLVYNVTGAATASGPMSVPISFGSVSCNVNMTVSAGTSVVMCGSSKAWARHNVGADTSLNPDIPVKGINGNYYQWGRIDVVADPDTPPGAISGWNTTPAPNLSWNASGSELAPAKNTANDPCPTGFRVPTRTEWNLLVNNSTRTTIGTTGGSPTNFGFGYVLTCGSNKLTFPAAGYREPTAGNLDYRGANSYYQSSTELGTTGQYYFDTVYGGVASNSSRLYGWSVRCISE